MSIRVVLADDHAMLREGLRSVLEKDSEIQVVGEAADGRTAVELCRTLAPDVVVMDIGMPDLNGVEAARRIAQASPAVRVLALSAYPNRGYVLGMLQAGAKGYVLKSAVSGELLRALREVMHGRHYLSSEIAGVVVRGATVNGDRVANSPYAVLAQRERQVLQLLAEGQAVKETAAALGISARTVETHRRNIMKKLDIHSIAELTKYAIREGLTRLEQ